MDLELTLIPGLATVPAGRQAKVGLANLYLARGPGDTDQADLVDLAGDPGDTDRADRVNLARADRVDLRLLARADRVIDAEENLVVSRQRLNGK